MKKKELEMLKIFTVPVAGVYEFTINGTFKFIKKLPTNGKLSRRDIVSLERKINKAIKKSMEGNKDGSN